MLRKLLKHEFRATARIMGPLYLVLLVTAIGANFSSRIMNSVDNWLLNILGALVIMAFVIAIIGVCFMSFALMLQRFYRNLLRDEGYIMFTLPASVHQQVWSKLIVSAVWFILTGVAVILSCVVAVYQVGFVTDFLRVMGRILENMTAYYALNGTAIALELAALCFVSCVAFALQFYAALAVGHSFSNHKLALSVAFFFAFQFVSQIAATVLLVAMGESPLFEFLATLDIRMSAMAGVHIGICLLVVLSAIYGAIFYFLTTYFLKDRLDLE
ncbi:hypothetical protein [Dysosmobacter sp.]|uniref:hypothetical protein n=1 Tax=Dysosmobacter sp. TaxID=2591382 RepID=UPI002A94A3CC|nr:hypothetical protein [Dysosmobacter sp.]MCI6055196.1 hypothetical protein [Dysosmobacter sp.]MDY5510340.1 hypothetical protein [Dysosmobacter sp.]